MNSETAERLREGMWRAYSEVAEQLAAEYPFPVGRIFAASRLWLSKPLPGYLMSLSFYFTRLI